MAYTTRTVKSSKGLSQEKALLTLQNHPEFKPGTKIASIHNQGGVWVAKILEPKVAGEECECKGDGCKKCDDKHKTAADAFEDIDESPADLHEDKHEEKESPLEEIEEHEKDDHEEKHEQSEEKKIKELEKKIDLLLDALGISEKGEDPDTLDEGPKGPIADAPAAPAPKGGPDGGPKKSEPLPPGSGAKLKPGEVPNKPGMTPVGSPAFASTRQATDGSMVVPTSPSASGPVGPAPTGVGSCPNCGGTAGNCTCSNAAGTPNVPGGASPTASGPVVASFTASKSDPMRNTSIRMAKAQLENEFEGFRVARIKRDGEFIRAHLTR